MMARQRRWTSIFITRRRFTGQILLALLYLCIDFFWYSGAVPRGKSTAFLITLPDSIHSRYNPFTLFAKQKAETPDGTEPRATKVKAPKPTTARRKKSTAITRTTTKEEATTSSITTTTTSTDTKRQPKGSIKSRKAIKEAKEDALWDLLRAEVQQRPGGVLEEYEEALGDLRRLGEWEAAWAKLDEAMTRGIEPSAAMYREVCMVCEKEGQPKGVLRLLEVMQQHQVPIEDQVLRAALTACHHLSNGTRAQEVLGTIPTPTAGDYGLVASACFRGGDRERALDLVEEAKVKGLRPYGEIYAPVMMACSESDEDWPLGLVLLQELKSLPDTSHESSIMEAYTAAVACAGRGYQPQEALRLLGEVREAGLVHHGPIIDLRAHCQALLACRRSLWYKEASAVMTEVRSLVRGWGQFYRRPVGLETLEDLGQGSTSALALLQCLVDDGLVPDSLSYGLSLEACGLEGRYDRIVLLHEMMRAADPTVRLGRIAPWKRLEPWEQMTNGVKEVASRVMEALEACGPALQGLADQLYEEAYAEGDFEHWSEDEEHMVDLHHLTAPLARAALRHVYDDALGRPSRASFHLEAVGAKLMIITGQGKGSTTQESRLRPVTLALLNEGMEPSQRAVVVPGNAGRVSVAKATVKQWVTAMKKEVETKQAVPLSDSLARCRLWREASMRRV